MRLVLQRVREASVTVDGRCVASMGRGVLLLVGVAEDDGPDDLDWLAAKAASLRVLDDAEGRMNLTLAEAGAEALCVSQFTLLASTRKGARPSWHRAAKAAAAEALFADFCRSFEGHLGRAVGRGVFGADMQVALVNDGPVTLVIDSRLRE